MKAMILAAGRGERMRPLTDTTPKPLLEIRGKPLVQWQIERLRDAGFDELVVNVSWLKEQLVDFLGDGARFGVNIVISEEPPEPLETAGGIVKALPWLGERFVVVNGDVFTDFDFSALRGLPDDGDLAHLVLVPNPAHHAHGDFCLHGGRVHAGEDERFTFAGIGAYHRELFQGLASGPRKLAPLLRDAMKHDRVSGREHAGEWSDVGTPERLEALDR
ncbi:MAG TPA: nucleotidyltransferase family protein [Gammaproteobacteria bacterium]